MKLTILFGQRTCSYDGEYAPESLEIACDVTMDSNPDWIYEKKDEYDEMDEFDTVALVEVDLGEDATKAIQERLYGNISVKGSVV